MAPTYSNMMKAGEQAPDFKLPNVDGKEYSLASFDEAEILVVVFSCNHCPYAIALEDRFIAIQHDYASKGVRLVFINPNDAVNYPEDSFENMKLRAAEKQYPFPYLRDESQDVAHAYNAACTPDVFVFDRKRALVYNGRVDDNWKEPEKVTRQDLRIVLDSILARTPIPFDTIPAMGCSIKWKAG